MILIRSQPYETNWGGVFRILSKEPRSECFQAGAKRNVAEYRKKQHNHAHTTTQRIQSNVGVEHVGTLFIIKCYVTFINHNQLVHRSSTWLRMALTPANFGAHALWCCTEREARHA